MSARRVDWLGVLRRLLVVVWPHDASLAYRVAAVLAVAAVWLYPHPNGVDLAQHANLFQIVANYRDASTGYRVFYYLDFFTPYAVTYAIGASLTKLFGALVAVKLSITLTVFALPAAMTRWLERVGADRTLGIFGFLLVFGFGYQWGFLSFQMSMAVACFFLAELATLLTTRHSWRQRTICAALAILLFFTHGVTFGFTMVAGGLICLFQRKLKTIVQDALLFVPVFLVLIPWHFRKVAHAAAGGDIKDFPAGDRFITLFSGAVSSIENFLPAVLVFAGVCVLVAIGKPTLNYEPKRLLPFALALFGFFTIPEWVSDTWLVGSRFIVFVHVFGFAAFDFVSEARALRRFRLASFGLVAVGLLSFHYRMFGFTREMAGFDEIAELIPRGEDVKLFTGEHESRALGPNQLGNVFAWITATRGGMLENDSSQYFQMPVQRRGRVPKPSEYTYFVTHGPFGRARKDVGPEADFVATRGRFHLFRAARTFPTIAGVKFVRYAQGWGKLGVDQANKGAPLKVAGKRFEHGLGTHARSYIQLRPEPGIRRISGQYGLDDQAKTDERVVFRVVDATRRVLWSSDPVSAGEPARSFDVAMDGLQGDAFLVVDAEGSIDGAHADWLNVTATP